MCVVCVLSKMCSFYFAKTSSFLPHSPLSLIFRVLESYFVLLEAHMYEISAQFLNLTLILTFSNRPLSSHSFYSFNRIYTCSKRRFNMVHKFPKLIFFSLMPLLACLEKKCVMCARSLNLLYVL